VPSHPVQSHPVPSHPIGLGPSLYKPRSGSFSTLYRRELVFLNRLNMNALRIGSSYSIHPHAEPCAVYWPESVPFFVEASVSMSARDKNDGKHNEIE
jgi:hypothetical protein